MSPGEIASMLAEKFGPLLTGVVAEDKHPRVHLAVENWRAVAEFLRHDSALSMDWLACLTGLDYTADERMGVLYDLYSFDRRHRFAVKVFAPRASATFPTVVDLWPAADWHEREAYDLLGIGFDGHPDLRRILMADDWEGFPLRKDYVFPRQYQGIPASVELDWQQK